MYSTPRSSSFHVSNLLYQMLTRHRVFGVTTLDVVRASTFVAEVLGDRESNSPNQSYH